MADKPLTVDGQGQQAPWVRRLMPWLLAAAGLILAYRLRAVLSPFLIGMAIAYMGQPLVERLCRLHLPRSAAVAVVFTMVFGVVILLVILVVPVLIDQFLVLIERLPTLFDDLQKLLRRFGVHVPPFDIRSLINGMAAHWREAGGVAARLAAYAGRSGAALFMFLANLVLIPVVSFYLMRDWHQVVAWGRSLISPRWVERLDDFFVEADRALGAFLRGQVLVMLVLAVIYTLGYTLVGVPQAVLVGFFAGLMNFVPYLGHVMAFLAASASLLVSGQLDWSAMLGVVAVLAVGQAMEQWFLTPRLVGERIGMHPVAVMFALLAGGELFGFTGLLLALPASAVAGVVVRHVRLWWHQDGSRQLP